MKTRDAIERARQLDACQPALDWAAGLDPEGEIETALAEAPDPTWRAWWTARTTRAGATIDPTARVHPDAAIYAGAVIGARADVREGAVVRACKGV